MRRSHSLTCLYIVLGFASAIFAEVDPGGIDQLQTPWVIAHKGGSLLWPEETMEAYYASTDAGNAFVDVDCFLLRDGSIGLMHDSALGRTTNRQGEAGQLNGSEWGDLRVDGAKLLGGAWGKYHAPFFDEVLVSFGNKKIISVEPKDGLSGAAIVRKLKEYRIKKNFVLVNSFVASQLRPALAAGYLTCINLSAKPEITPKAAKKSGYWAVALPASIDKSLVPAYKAAGLKVLIYTVNRRYQWSDFDKLGVDGFFTDDPIYMESGKDHRSERDSFRTQKFDAGMLEAQPGGRGSFVAPDRWSIDTSTNNAYKGCLQGWLSPRLDKPASLGSEWTLELSVTFGRSYEKGRWASVAILTTDAPLGTDGGAVPAAGGYHILFPNTGGLLVYRFPGEGRSPPLLLHTSSGEPIPQGTTVRYRITMGPEKMKAERLDGKASLTVVDSTYRGAFITFGAKGQQAEFSDILLSAHDKN